MITRRRQTLYLLLILALTVSATVRLQAQTAPSSSVIPQSGLLQPEELHAQLHTIYSKALILQVGSRVLFDEAHIPGSEYAGPDSRPEGLEKLRTRVKGLPHDQSIVIYCGCCPWSRCPNIGPAWTLLHDLGFTQVKALYIADNFGKDWVSKGFRADATH